MNVEVERADKHHLQIFLFSNITEEYNILIGFLSRYYNVNMKTRPQFIYRLQGKLF